VGPFAHAEFGDVVGLESLADALDEIGRGGLAAAVFKRVQAASRNRRRSRRGSKFLSKLGTVGSK
jgi:hypothetical protein